MKQQEWQRHLADVREKVGPCEQCGKRPPVTGRAMGSVGRVMWLCRPCWKLYASPDENFNEELAKIQAACA